MRRKPFAAAALAKGLVLAMGLSVGLAAAGAPAQAQSLRMGAAQQGSQNYGVNAALAQSLGERTGIGFSLQSFGGPAAYLPLLDSGELDIAAAVMPDLGDAMRGAGPFEGLQLENLRLVASLFPSPVGLMVAADSPYRSIADLAGQRVAWGLTAQPSLLPYVQGALANGGLTLDAVRLVPVTSVASAVDELIAGRVDAALFALRGGKVVEADSALGGIRWLPFDASEAAVAAMQEIAPEAYLVPAEADALGVEAPIMTMAYDYALAVGAEVEDALVEAVLAALIEDAAAISAEHAVLGQLDPATYHRGYPGLEWHPAALRLLAAD